MKTFNQNMGQKGAVLVETAIVLPLLLLLTFGIIEFSILFYNKAMVTNASREGARAGIVFAEPRASDDYIKTIIKTYCGNHLITFGTGAGTPLGDGDIDIDPAGSRDGLAPGDSLKVTVHYHYDFLVVPNILFAFFGGSTLEDGLTLSAVTVMRME